ncbi:MAG: hypothetical protein IPI67_04060 [Myxococcales bacterium]|nr:hypothetical protein [Myxococcales bacterium]
MRKATILGVFALGLAAVGCGAGGAHAPASPGGSYESASAPASQPGGYGGPAAESAPSPAAAGEAEKSADVAGRERPGLGTEWGENRESRVSTSAFFRDRPDQPFDVVKMFYNDNEGVRAMARRAGVSDFSDSSGRATRGAITVRLLDGSGRPLEGFSSSGNTYVIGGHGQRYIIQIKNNTGVRFEAVTTVDGLDVINGRSGSFSNRGYIVNGFSTVEIDGWRRSSDTVASFRFGRVSDSYAGKKGDDRNVGVIGVALFEERGATFSWTQEEVDKRHGADPFPGKFAAPPPGNF